MFLRTGQIGVLDLRRAEVLDNAAKLIQRQLRTFIARKDFVVARAAALVLQAYCRGFCFELHFVRIKITVLFIIFCSFCPFFSVALLFVLFCFIPLLSHYIYVPDSKWMSLVLSDVMIDSLLPVAAVMRFI